MNDDGRTDAETDLDRLIRTVTRDLSIADPNLPAAFFPAHLPSALIDAVAATRPTQCNLDGNPSRTYCAYFDVPCTRPDLWRVPGRNRQYAVSSLIADASSIENETIERLVFQPQSQFPGTKRSRAHVLLDAAERLREADIEVLQDACNRSPALVQRVLAPVGGENEELARWLLMFTGTDRFVLGDEVVRNFVAHATDRATIGATEAATLLRRCAHEWAVSPRYLDYRVHQAFGR